jgi:peptidoglycan-N-acetylglucosamine deacetylase
VSGPADQPSWQWPEEDWRALVGRVRAGRRLRPKTWNGARCAVALSFDCDHETFEMGQGGRAMGRIAWGEFGRRVGVPRILETLSRHDVRASFFMPAVAALIDPDEPRRIVAEGHELGIHGWIHENNSLLPYEIERDLMERSRDTLRRTSGTEPVGLRSANWDTSPNTIRIVKEMGLSYDSSMMADEDPYELLLDGEPTGIVEVPVEWLRDDAVYFLFNRNPSTRPYTPPTAVLDIFRGRRLPAGDASVRHRLPLAPLHPRRNHSSRKGEGGCLVCHPCRSRRSCARSLDLNMNGLQRMDGLQIPDNAPHVPPQIGTVVIGGGIVGLCLARILAREGCDVAVVDSGRDAGSSANAGSLHVQMQSRFIRMYPDQVPALERALPL